MEVIALAVDGIPRRWIASSPKDQIEVRIVGAGDPGASAAVRASVAWPRLGAWLARSRNREGPPQLLACLRIQAFEIATVPELRAGHPGDHHAVGHERSGGHRVAVLGGGWLRAPHLLACLDVERDHVRVEGGAVEFAVEQRTTAVDDTAADDPGGVRRILDHRLPDRSAGNRVEGDSLFVIGEVDDAILEQRLGLLA